MQLDFSFLLAIFFPFMALAILPMFMSSFMNKETNPDQLIGEEMRPAFLLFGVVVFAMLNKDFFSGRSIAKRKLGYQVINVKTNKVASEFQCMFRNVTSLIWPVEIVVSLVSPSRRIGDLIDGTKIRETTPIAVESILSDIQEKKISVWAMVTLGVSALIAGLNLFLFNPETWIGFITKQ